MHFYAISAINNATFRHKTLKTSKKEEFAYLIKQVFESEWVFGQNRFDLEIKVPFTHTNTRGTLVRVVLYIDETRLLMRSQFALKCLINDFEQIKISSQVGRGVQVQKFDEIRVDFVGVRILFYIAQCHGGLVGQLDLQVD